MNAPLAGLRIVVTRAAHQAQELAQPLSSLGAEVILLPVIGIAAPENPHALAKAIEKIDSFDWIIFTSTNGVRALGTRKCRARVATVGAATRALAEGFGWMVELTPETYVAEALVEAFDTEQLRGQRILIPSAAATRDVVREELTSRGAIVELVEAYRNVIPAEAAENANSVFQPPYPDWITFASSSAVQNLATLIPTQKMQQAKIASIGPVTSETVREHGMIVSAEAERHDVQGLVDALVAAQRGAD